MALASGIARTWHALSSRLLAFKTAGYDRYELVNGKVIRSIYGRTIDLVSLADIISWQIEHEMIFDIVLLNLRDCSTTTWLDYKNDLIEILHREVPGLELGNRANDS